MMTDVRKRRPGFTLIEMLVVITIIILLASLTVAFLPSINDHKKASDGASIVQNTLLLAKQRALRDQAPRGVRLIPDPSNKNYASSLQYIEQPDDFTGGTVTGPVGAAPVETFTFSGVDLWGGFGPSDPTVWPVQPGDYLVMQQTNLYLIIGVSASTMVQAMGPSSASGTTSDYRIVRAPRPLLAEAPVELPQDVAIDLTGVGQSNPPPPVTRSIIVPDFHAPPSLAKPGVSHLDILFSPSGAVVRQGSKAGKFILWVRDITKPDLDGDQVLVTVYTRTGMVVPHPADPTNNYANPYTFTEDGRDSGD
ncbi:MAG TPA: type II secretion system protein [Gemmataceae bacterium]|nr:type II secretion system protein [Gemmataceae bacterium]